MLVKNYILVCSMIMWVPQEWVLWWQGAAEGYLFRGYLPPRHELKAPYNHSIF